jgi:hypothetical protein
MGARMNEEEEIAALNKQIMLIFAIEFCILVVLVYYLAILNSLEQTKVTFVACVMVMATASSIAIMQNTRKKTELGKRLAEKQGFEQRPPKHF